MGVLKSSNNGANLCAVRIPQLCPQKKKRLGIDDLRELPRPPPAAAAGRSGQAGDKLQLQLPASRSREPSLLELGLLSSTLTMGTAIADYEHKRSVDLTMPVPVVIEL